jgi:hypothetical protein
MRLICIFLVLFYLLAFNACGTGIITEDLRSDSLYNESDYNVFKQGPCKKVPEMYRVNTIVYGQYAQGYSGDIDCWSDVYSKHGVRISPNNVEGRIWYDFGPIEKDTIKITFQWVDNAWLNASKKLQIYNWQKNKWHTMELWNGNNGEEHFTEKVIIFKKEYNKDGCVRVALYSSSFAIIHLNSIKIN